MRVLGKFCLLTVVTGIAASGGMAAAQPPGEVVESEAPLDQRVGAPASPFVVEFTDDVRINRSEIANLELLTQAPFIQSWKVWGGSGGWGVQDGSSRVPLVIETGAPSQSLRVKANGDVGLGTYYAASALHVIRSDGTAQLRVQETSTTSTGRNLARFINNGAATFRFDNTASSGLSWGFGSRQAGDFFISTVGASTVQMSLTSAGNMTINGTLTQGSDRDAKDDVAAIDPADVLDKLVRLPIATWRYRGDAAWHVGPMAQDFHAAFGLGADDKHIAPGDAAGLGLAAIQALRAELARRDAEVAALNQRVAALEALVRGR